MSWDSRGSFGLGGLDTFTKLEQLPPIHFGDGPPWSEDEDIQSPIVVSSRHKKHRSTSGPLGSAPGRGRSRNSRDEGGRSTSLLNPENYEQDRGFYAGRNGDGSERYYVNQGGEANGPGGEYVTYPADQARHPGMAPYNTAPQRDSHFAGTLLPSKSYQEAETPGYRSDSDASSSDSSPGMANAAESRYSRDYQFTIASPDEEMHGKAVALFDFQRENENELPLVEGQVIWVSYRHGQGWLVAEDPKTHESGLVPEEYVRLLRDIQGGLHSLTGQVDGLLSPGGSAQDSGTPTQADHGQPFNNVATASNGSNGYQQPIVSTFSTSSKDLHPYPPHLLGTQAGMAPPQVVHYHGQRGGSQANTPTLANPAEGTLGGTRGSEDVKGSVEWQDGSAKSTAVAYGKDELSVSPLEDDSDDSDED
jgi:SH3 domain